MSYFSAMAMTAVNRERIEDGHVVFFRHGHDGGEQGAEILLLVDDYLTEVGKQDVSGVFQAQPLMDVRAFNGRQVFMEHLRHRRAGDVHPLLGQAAIVELFPGVVGVGQVQIGDVVVNAPVGFLRCAGWFPPAGTRPCSGCPPPCGKWECAAAWPQWRTG